jgi:SecD/SecF fusion protein
MPGSEAIKKAGLSGLFLCAVLAVALPGRTFAAPVRVEVTAAEAAFNSSDNMPLVSARMSDASRVMFAELTAQNIGRKLLVLVDGRLMSSPVIREPITGGTFQIAGGLTAQQAGEIAGRLAAGTARLEFEIAD